MALVRGGNEAMRLSDLELFVLMATERRDKQGEDIRALRADDVRQKPVRKAVQAAGTSVEEVFRSLAKKGFLARSGSVYAATQPGNDVKHTFNQMKEVLAIDDAYFRTRKNDFASIPRLLEELQADADVKRAP